MPELPEMENYKNLLSKKISGKNNNRCNYKSGKID